MLMTSYYIFCFSAFLHQYKCTEHKFHDSYYFLYKCNNVPNAIIVNTKRQQFQHKNHQACSDRQLMVQSFSAFCGLTTQRQTSLVLTWIFHTIALLHWLGGENMSRVVHICPSFNILSMLVHNSTASPFVLYSLSEWGGGENPSKNYNSLNAVGQSSSGQYKL